MNPVPDPSDRGDARHVPFVSVIMNCHNSARYLHSALESVRDQTFGDWEIIFWDNRSTDESAGIFKSFDDSRFHYFLAPEHTVLGAAKRLAIARARGEWLAFLDCDDLWSPDKLASQTAIIARENQELGLVYGRMAILVEPEARDTGIARAALATSKRHKGRNMKEGNVFADLLRENFIPQPSMMVRHSAYLAVGGVDSTLQHGWDYDLALKVLKRFRARAIQVECCSYRIHSTNLSHSHADVVFLEAFRTVGGHLPDPAARRGLRALKTAYAASLLRRRRYATALRYFLEGDLRFLLRKGYERLAGSAGNSSR